VTAHVRKTRDRPCHLSCLAGLLCLLALPWLPETARAQETAAASPLSAAWIDRMLGDVRSAAATLAQELDAFLSDREYEAGLNRTRIALRFGADIGDDEIEPILEPRLRLSLPNTERLLFLDVLGADGAPGDGAAPQGSILDEDLPGSVEAIQLRLGATFRGVDLAPSVGLRAEDGDLRAYAGLRLSAARALTPAVTLFGSQRFLVDSVRRFKTISLLRADWETDAATVWRGQVEVDWRGDRDGLLWEPSVVYRRFLNPRTAVSLENTLSVYTADAEPDEFVSALRLRRQLGRDWLFAEVRPWLSVEIEPGRETGRGFEVLLDVTF
jgi:hypothetical protein